MPENSGHETNFVTKICPACKCEASTVERRRRNTSYFDDTLNWTELCIDCFDADCEYWAERWDDHWRGRL